MTFRQIVNDFLTGLITRDEVEKLLGQLWNDASIPPNQINQALESWYEVLRANSTDARGFIVKPKPATTQSVPTYSTKKPLTTEAQRYLTEDPIAAWYRAKGLPTVGGNPFQKWSGAQWAPAYSAYAGQELLKEPGSIRGSFEPYMAGDAGYALTGETAQRALQGARARTGPQQELWRGNLEGEDVGGSLKDLLQAAIEGQGYASPFARAFVKNVPGFERQWQTETLHGKQEGSDTVLAYLMKQLGL